MAYIETSHQDGKTLQYRRVFNTPDGKAVLQDMLVDLNVFSAVDPKDHESVALRNYGITLMYNVGILTDDNLEPMVDKLMSMEYTSKVTSKEN